MIELDKGGQLGAPALGDDEPGEVSVVRPEGISAADKVEAQVGVDKAFAVIKAQPYEKVRVPKLHGPQVVVINGARFDVPANVFVPVPAQVAQVLRDAGRI